MSEKGEVVRVHPEGEGESAGKQPLESVTNVDTFAGKIHVKWAPEASVSSLGLMVFFIEFLKTSGLIDRRGEHCPRHHIGGQAPEKGGLMATTPLPGLSGLW